MDGRTKLLDLHHIKLGFVYAFRIGVYRDDACIVATDFEKITHFENFFQSALNVGPNQRTLKKNFKVR